MSRASRSLCRVTVSHLFGTSQESYNIYTVYMCCRECKDTCTHPSHMLCRVTISTLHVNDSTQHMYVNDDAESAKTPIPIPHTWSQASQQYMQLQLCSYISYTQAQQYMCVGYVATYLCRVGALLTYRKLQVCSYRYVATCVTPVCRIGTGVFGHRRRSNTCSYSYVTPIEHTQRGV